MRKLLTAVAVAASVLGAAGPAGALEGGPAAIDPLAFGVETVETVDAVTPSTGFVQGCWDMSTTEHERNILHMDLFTWKMAKHWCGHGGVPFAQDTITSAPPVQLQPNVSTLGGAFGWQYRQVISTNTGNEYYQVGHDPSHTSGHASWATAEFDLCVAGKGCFQQLFPHIWINAHYDGGYVYGGNMGGTEK